MRRAGSWLWRWRCRLVGAAVILVLLAARLPAYDYRRDEAAGVLRQSGEAIQIRLDRRRPVGRHSDRDFNALPNSAEIFSGRRLAIPRLHLRRRGWPADRNLAAAQLGFDRIFLNCAACHVGTYRAHPASKPVVVWWACRPTAAPRPIRAVPHGLRARRALQSLAGDPGRRGQRGEILALRPVVLKYVAVPAIASADPRAFPLPLPGPRAESGSRPLRHLQSLQGAIQWPIEQDAATRAQRASDFPSPLDATPPRGHGLHWDGNNTSVEERNLSAALGAGAVPTTVDQGRSCAYRGLAVDSAKPPPFPAADRPAGRARQDAVRRLLRRLPWPSGPRLHGRPGRQGGAARAIRTDPCRSTITRLLAAAQDNLYAGYPDGGSRISARPTDTPTPLDGIWLRAPYLHNGSVPTCAICSSRRRSARPFYRGYDVIDQRGRLPLRPAPEKGVAFFRLRDALRRQISPNARGERKPGKPSRRLCVPGKWAGNSNRGHEGKEYGTDLRRGQGRHRRISENLLARPL